MKKTILSLLLLLGFLSNAQPTLLKLKQIEHGAAGQVPVAGPSGVLTFSTLPTFVSTTDLDPVISQTNTPPGAPTTGDRYLVGTSPTGAFVGSANKIAEWGGSSWSYTTPVTDDIVYVTSTATTLRYNGTAWVAWAGTSILQNGNSLASNVVIGTNNLKDLVFKTNNSATAIMKTNGSWGIRTLIPSATMSIKGLTSDNTTVAFDAKNLAGDNLLSIRNDGLTQTAHYFKIKSSSGSFYPTLIYEDNSGNQASLLSTGSDFYFSHGSQTTFLGQSGLSVGKSGVGPSISRLHIRGPSSGSSDYSARFDNSSDASLLYIRNDGVLETGVNNSTYSLKIGNSPGGYGTGQGNNSFGYASLQDITTASGNNTHGNLTGTNITTGGYNNLFGDGAGQYFTTHTQNAGFGHAVLATWEGNYNTAIGPGAGMTGQGDLNLIAGYAALQTTGTKNLNVSLGAYSGNLNVGSSNIFFGPYAAYRQTTASNRLFIDNQDRGSSANELTKSLIVGTFDSAPSSQELRVNGTVVSRVENAVYPDASLNNSQYVMYLDEANDKIIIKFKKSDGTVKTVELLGL